MWGVEVEGESIKGAVLILEEGVMEDVEGGGARRKGKSGG